MSKRSTMLDEAKRQIAALPRPVQNWMLWLNIVFLAGLPFIASYDAVRWVMVAYAICFPVAVPFFLYTRDITMSGVPHILFWTPLLVYLPMEAANDPNFSVLSAYGAWTALLLLTISVSVAFDARAVVNYFSRRNEE